MTTMKDRVDEFFAQPVENVWAITGEPPVAKDDVYESRVMDQVRAILPSVEFGELGELRTVTVSDGDISEFSEPKEKFPSMEIDLSRHIPGVGIQLPGHKMRRSKGEY